MTSLNGAAQAANGDARLDDTADQIPAIAELNELGPRFCLWKTVVRDGKATKMPIQPTSGEAASSTDPTTWASLADCKAAQKRRRAAGIGFFFNGDGYGGVDLDACRDQANGAIADWGQRWIDDCASYTEVSPTGTGVKIIFKAEPMPTLRGNKRTVGEAADGKKVPAVELYTTGRYFALTGQHLEGTPDEIVDATEAVERLVRWIAEGKESNADAAGATFNFAELPEIVVRLLEAEPRLKAAWASGEKLTKGNDNSASGRDYSLTIWLATRGWDDATIEAALRAYPHGQISKLDAKEADRQVKRLLRKAEKCRERVARAREAAA
jgi:primase-polymerase (primpol)-like protein